MTEKDVLNQVIFTELIKRTNDICFVYNVPEKKFVYTNAAMQFFFSMPDENIRDTAGILLNKLHEDDVAYAIEQYQKLLDQHVVEDVVLRIQMVNKLCSLKLEAWLLDMDGTTYITGLGADITDEAEQMLVLNKFAEKKNSILEILSHDLTGPLGNIKMYAALLQSNTLELKNEQVVDILNKIASNSEKSLKLIREFLKKEFLETFEAALVKMRIDIVDKINNFIEEFRKAGPDLVKTITVTAHTQPIYVHVDEPKFIQVLQNLLSNAMKFTTDDGKIDIDIRDEGDDVLISIADDGIGIPAALQKNIFERFSPAGRPGLKGEKSVGLGMSIIKKIVEWHNGHIWFKSEENKGTTFYVQIPKESETGGKR